MNKAKYSFSGKTFLIGLAILLGGLALAYYQYQLWFEPEIIAGTAIRKFNLGGILLAGAAILAGFIVIFQAFRAGADIKRVFMPQEKYDDLKKGIDTKEVIHFKKLLEGESTLPPHGPYTALTIEYFKNQPGMAIINGSIATASEFGQYYEDSRITSSVQVDGAILQVLTQIEQKYSHPEGYQV